MTSLKRGDKVFFTIEGPGELAGLKGIICKVRFVGSHYLYDVKVNIKLPIINSGSLKISGQLLRCIPSYWIELAPQYSSVNNPRPVVKNSTGAFQFNS